MSQDTIGRRIRQLRGYAGVSARELDRLVGRASQGYTALIEADRRGNISADIARGYARVLGCSLDWLINGSGKAPTVNTVSGAVAAAAAAIAASRGRVARC